ncbi:MAG: pyruvate formate lyase family protein [Bilophila wadsworthia]
MDGLDAVNPLSYLMLQATIDTQMVQPSLSVRLSRKNPEDFFLKIAELIQTGSGFPAIYSDEIGMKQLMKKGIPPELAHDWVGLGCVEANMPGKMSQWSSAGHYNIAAAVEFALSNGVHLKSGKKLGLETSDPASFTTFEQFRDAVRQLAHLLTFSSMQNLLELPPTLPAQPRASMVLLDCVEKGKDLMRGGARYNTGPGMNGNGVADYADSMVAVKKLVFDEKKVDMATLADAVKHDFKGYEPLLRLIDEEAPKWGNDDPEADAMVIDLTSFIIKKIAAFRGLLGNQKLPALYPVSSMFRRAWQSARSPRAAVPSGPLRKAVPPVRARTAPGRPPYSVRSASSRTPASTAARS